MISLFPLTVTPVTVFAFLASIAFAPTMSLMNGTTGDCIAGLSARLIAKAKFCAVTGLPSLNLKPLLTVIVYVLPSREMTGNPLAASGRILLPSGAGRSG